MLGHMAIGLALVCITTMMHASSMITGLRISHWRITRQDSDSSTSQGSHIPCIHGKLARQHGLTGGLFNG
jgi:hypothetical protein